MSAKAQSETETQTPVEPASGRYGHYHHGRSWLVPTLIIVIVILFIGMIVGWANNHRGRFGTPTGFGAVKVQRAYGGGSTGRFGGGGTNQNRLMGVVTAVNGSSFTLAGSGSTNSVQTNSSTQYQNGSSVAVNDTVTVFGTINNGSFTASQIVINP